MRDLAESDRAFATELFYGVLRNLSLLDFWIGLLRAGNLDDNVARYSAARLLPTISCSRTPEHAAVYETVELAAESEPQL